MVNHSSHLPRPAPLPRFVTVGFVGKRKLGVAGESLTQALENVLDHLAADHPSPAHQLVGLSSLALGADSLFAEACAHRGHLHQVYLPEPASRFFDKADFEDDDELVQRSRGLLSADNVIEVRVASRADDRGERFAETGFEIAAECEVLLVACPEAEAEAALADPSAPASPLTRGSSAETLRHARRLGRRLFVIQLDKQAADGTLAIREIPAPDAALAASAHAEPDFFAADPPAPLAGLDFRAALNAIKNQASADAGRAKFWFVNGGLFVLLAHILATIVAAWAVVMHPQNLLDILLGYAKFLFLFAGLAIAWILHHRAGQRRWLRARLIAEICRSTIALLGKKGNPQAPTFPGSLRHLRDFHLGELAAFTKSLNILFLREVRRQGLDSHALATVHAFAQAYVGARLDAPKSQGGQIAFYKEKADAAKILRRRFDRFFFGFALAATLLAGAALVWQPHDEPWLRVALKFLPLTLPVAAVGAVGWIALRDLDREAERYTDMLKVLRSLRDPLLCAETLGQLRRGVQRVERALLQEVVEWYAKMNYHRV